MLIKEVSSTIFCVFGMIRAGIELWSSGWLAEHFNHYANGPIDHLIKHLEIIEYIKNGLTLPVYQY